ncbi:hypothetical protein ACQ4PT_031749 [Festuca glaucescens]
MAAAMKLDTLGYAARMFSTGLLDEQFQQLLLLQDGSEQNFVAKIVTLFCQEAERIIGELAMQLDKPCVNFDEVAAFADKLEGSSACVGAQSVKNFCIQLDVVCQWRSRDRCLKTLAALRAAFYDLRGKFKAMLQLEQQQAEATK